MRGELLPRVISPRRRAGRSRTCVLSWKSVPLTFVSTRAAAPPLAQKKATSPAAKTPAKSAARERGPRKQSARADSHKNAALRNLAVGQKMSGAVTNVTDFGAFVNLGDCDGLIHKTGMGRHRNEHPSEVFTVGEQVSVVVVSVDVERERTDRFRGDRPAGPTRSFVQEGHRCSSGPGSVDQSFLRFQRLTRGMRIPV